MITSEQWSYFKELFEQFPDLEQISIENIYTVMLNHYEELRHLNWQISLERVAYLVMKARCQALEEVRLLH